MDGPSSLRSFGHRPADPFSANEDGVGDLLDLSEPFSWQMPHAPRTPPSMSRRMRNELNRELHFNVQRASAESRHSPHGTSRSSVDTGHIGNSEHMPGDSRRAAASFPFTYSGSSEFHFRPQPSSSSPSSSPPTHLGYMERASPFSLDPPVKEESVKEEPMESSCATWPAEVTATITYVADDGEIAAISGLNVESLEQRCLLLALAMEDTKSGKKLHLEALTSATADAFVRYLSTGSYALDSSDFDVFANVPTSLLFHCQLYRLGVIYDLADLKSQANVNILRNCEFGCSTPDKPIDLCPAIKYAYEHLRESPTVRDTIVNYCVSCFLQHRLDDDFEFRQVAYDLRPFHQDLCRNSMERGFENETASAIIQMPFKPFLPETYASREDVDGQAYTDFVHHFHGLDDEESAHRKRKRAMEVSLPLRTIALDPFDGNEGDDVNDGASISPFSDIYAINEAGGSRKRRASTITQPSIGSDASSEPDYELVAAPAAVEALNSETESDSETVSDSGSAEHVAAPRSAATARLPYSLPIRQSAHVHVPSATTAEDSTHDGSSDSEWSLV